MAITPSVPVDANSPSYYGVDPEAVKLRRALALKMQQEGMDFSPTQHPLQAFARALQGTLGGYLARKADEESAAGRDAAAQEFLKIYNGTGGGVTPTATTAPTPDAEDKASPVSAPSGTGTPTPVSNPLNIPDFSLAEKPTVWPKAGTMPYSSQPDLAPSSAKPFAMSGADITPIRGPLAPKRPLDPSISFGINQSGYLPGAVPPPVPQQEVSAPAPTSNAMALGPTDEIGAAVDKADAEAAAPPIAASPQQLAAVQWKENPWGNPAAVSPTGAEGLMQVQPDTARDPGLGVAPAKYATGKFDPNNPADVAENKRVGTDYFNALLNRYNGNFDAALIGYNAGMRRADKWMRSGGKAAIPAETVAYVKDIKDKLAQKTASAEPMRLGPEDGGDGIDQSAVDQTVEENATPTDTTDAGTTGQLPPEALHFLMNPYADPVQKKLLLDKYKQDSKSPYVTLPDGTQTFRKGGPHDPAVIEREAKARAKGAAELEDLPVVQENVKGIIRGDLPPTLSGNSRLSPSIKAGLSRERFNLSKAQTQWAAAQKQVTASNSTQMLRLRGNAISVVNTIDEAKDLAEQMKNSGMSGLNRVKLDYLMHYRGNTPEGQLATRYLTAVNTLKEEFTSIASGGYAPTEAAWKLANDQVNGNFGVDQFMSSITELQRLINYRIKAFDDQSVYGPGSSNPYTGHAPVPDMAQPTAAPANTPAPPPGFRVVP